LISYILAILCAVVFLGVDQITKYFVSTDFALGESREFLNGFIDLVYIHNRGGAWGIMYGKTLVLVIITAIMLFVCTFVLIKMRENKLLFWAVSLVLSGGIGNMIDRIFRDGNVVDFLHFEFFPTFPVFNVADCAVVIGAGLLILYFIIDMVKEKKKNENS
jgi:signal peptidase II